MKGERLAKLLSTEDVYYLTNGGKEVYAKYLGKDAKMHRCPWRRDRGPSFGIFSANGIYFWKDIGKEESGTAIQFVQRMFNLDFKGAIHKIIADFSLEGKEVPENHIFKSVEKKPKLITVETMPFAKRHHDYWNQAEVSEAWCSRYDCYALKSAAIDRQRFYIASDEPAFGYYAREENKWKIYLPMRTKGNKFRNAASYRYLWNYGSVEVGKPLIIQKSPKDLIVTALLYPNVIATQAEMVKIFDEPTVDKIKTISDDVYISYGSDDDGKEKSIAISQAFNWKWVNPPNEYLPEVNDFFGLVAKYGLEELNKLLTNKGIL